MSKAYTRSTSNEYQLPIPTSYAEPSSAAILAPITMVPISNPCIVCNEETEAQIAKRWAGCPSLLYPVCEQKSCQRDALSLLATEQFNAFRWTHSWVGRTINVPRSDGTISQSCVLRVEKHIIRTKPMDDKMMMCVTWYNTNDKEEDLERMKHVRLHELIEVNSHLPPLHILLPIGLSIAQLRRIYYMANLNEIKVAYE
jgi:hypothetical protein